LLRQSTQRFATAELGERLDRHNVWWAPINYYDELLDDPQLKHCQVFRKVQVRGRTIHLVNHPNRYDGKVPEVRVLALEIGEHTYEVMLEIGFSKVETQELVKSGAVVASRDPELERKVVNAG
jgi:crotonobetainyl-CoA:carnitine CoA-transferase CaiB-like acyl-CoA transferase